MKMKKSSILILHVIALHLSTSASSMYCIYVYDVRVRTNILFILENQKKHIELLRQFQSGCMLIVQKCGYWHKIKHTSSADRVAAANRFFLFLYHSCLMPTLHIIFCLLLLLIIAQILLVLSHCYPYLLVNRVAKTRQNKLLLLFTLVFQFLNFGSFKLFSLHVFILYFNTSC